MFLNLVWRRIHHILRRISKMKYKAVFEEGSRRETSGLGLVGPGFNIMREDHGRVGIISRGIQGSCYRLCFSKMKPRLKHEATKELQQISTSNSICLHRFVSGFDSCWTYRLHASHDYRKFFKKFVFLASPKNPGCYSPPSLQESHPRD